MNDDTFEDPMNPLYELLQRIAAGEAEQADELLDAIISHKANDALDNYREALSQSLFATTEGTEITEGNAENKAKKNAHEDSIGRKMIKKNDAAGHNVRADTRHNPRRLTRVGRSLGYTDKSMKEEVLAEGNAENKAKKNAVIGKDTFSRARFQKKQGKENGDLNKNRRTATAKHIIKKIFAKESVEQLDELSKKTLGNYVNKAASSAFGAGHDAAGSKFGSSKSMKGYDKGTKRLSGIRKAMAKLTKEEVEQLDELSRKTLGKYIKKAKVSRDTSADRAEGSFASSENRNDAAGRRQLHKSGMRHLAKKMKRVKGIASAKTKLRSMKEENTQNTED